jgi:ABC-2 type transport system permease protein
MAVYKRAYRPYDGALTPTWSRPLVMPRYALQEVFESRLLVFFLAICFVPFLVESALVYVANSAAAQAVLGIAPDASRRDLFEINANFFLYVLTGQGALAFFLTAWVAPVLVSPDLVNGALPLYLARPLTRADYVLGKAAALAALLSLVTWVPVLALFGLQAGSPSGPGWPRTIAAASRSWRARGSGSPSSRCWAWPSPHGSNGGSWPRARCSASSSWAAPSARHGARRFTTRGGGWPTSAI